MCNLNIFIKGDEFLNKDLSEFVSFINTATYNSFINNNDGEGVYFSENNVLITSRNKINYLNYFENFNNSNFIITHQRYATTGLNEKYTHPFKRGSFILAHNGVMNDWAKKGHSDTYIFFKRFYEMFNSLKGDRNKNIIKTIKKLLKGEGGSYSIALYDEQTKTLYYFKNDGASITAYINKDKNGLYLTTSDYNTNFLKVFRSDFKEYDINDYTIYKINLSNKGKITINKAGVIKERQQNNISYVVKNNTINEITENDINLLSGGNEISEEYFKKDNFTNDLNPFKRCWGVERLHNKTKCDNNCGNKTRNSEGYIGSRLCDECLYMERDNLGYEQKDYNKSSGVSYVK